MILQQVRELEQQRLKDVKDEYEGKGYNVVVEPSEADLPEVLAPYQIDLIARKGQENVAALVSAQTRLVERAYLPDLVEAVNTLTGWRLELNIVSPDEEEIVNPDAHLLTRDEIYARLVQVHALLEAADFDTAMLLCWATVEGALRLLAYQEQIDLAECTPATMVDKLYSLGLFGREEYDVIHHALRFRNTLVHGYKTMQRDPKFVEQLIMVVEALLPAS